MQKPTGLPAGFGLEEEIASKHHNFPTVMLMIVIKKRQGFDWPFGDRSFTEAAHPGLRLYAGRPSRTWPDPKSRHGSRASTARSATRSTGTK
jgi:hypothetical protein